MEPGIALPWICVHAGYALMGGDSIYRPHAVLELMHQSIQSSTADQLSASGEDCNIHDQSSVALECHLPSSAMSAMCQKQHRLIGHQVPCHLRLLQ